MDKDQYKIAVASSDGIVVNNHFGRASEFYIYQINDKKIQFIEKRNVIPVCDRGNHDDNRLKENLLTFKDCKYLLVSRIGEGAVSMARQVGIECYEIPGVIEDSINQLIKYNLIKNLFE